MQNSQLPLKWYKPFAADDAAKVEIPVTTPDPARASQSLGFPPLTMQPPESGGVPPQGEDFNGAMNQVARVAWWMLAGGALPFDASWAGNANIGGYPQGAAVTSADLQGEWLSTADNNTNNPDTVGTGWVPGYAYGSTSLTGLANANVTLTPAQAAKGTIRLAGALTGSIQIIFPTWLKDWNVINNCTGGFSVTCKTAAGSGVVVPQGGGTQIVWGDGTNLNALLQMSGRLLRTLTYKLIAGVQNVSINGGAYTPTGAGTYLAGLDASFIRARVQAGGGGGGGAAATAAGEYAAGAGGTGGAYGEGIYTTGFTGGIAITVGAKGAASTAGNNPGGNGGTSSVAALLSTPGGAGGPGGPTNTLGNGSVVDVSPSALPTGANVLAKTGAGGGFRFFLSSGQFIGSRGGAAGDGASGPPMQNVGAGAAATNTGAGGSAATQGQSLPASAGGAGGDGYVIIEEFAL